MTGSYVQISSDTVTVYPTGNAKQRIEHNEEYTVDDWYIVFIIFMGVYVAYDHHCYFFFGKPPRDVTKRMLRWNRSIAEICFAVIGCTVIYSLILTLRHIFT